MLTQEQIEFNKNLFLELLSTVEGREGSDIPSLVQDLSNSDFFYAPASTKYHSAYAGGLCEHSLNVYNNLCSLVELNGLSNKIKPDTIVIVGLLHDISKVNYYELTSFNKKVYCVNGSKSDLMGNFEWKSVPGYKIREDSFLYGSHEMNSEFLIRRYIPLSTEESIAVLHHMGGKGADSVQDDVSRVFGASKLSVLLHIADLMATYIDEVV